MRIKFDPKTFNFIVKSESRKSFIERVNIVLQNILYGHAFVTCCQAAGLTADQFYSWADENPKDWKTIQNIQDFIRIKNLEDKLYAVAMSGKGNVQAMLFYLSNRSDRWNRGSGQGPNSDTPEDTARKIRDFLKIAKERTFGKAKENNIGKSPVQGEPRQQ